MLPRYVCKNNFSFRWSIGGGLVWWCLLVMLACLFFFLLSFLTGPIHPSINYSPIYVTSPADQFGKGDGWWWLLVVGGGRLLVVKLWWSFLVVSLRWSFGGKCWGNCFGMSAMFVTDLWGELIGGLREGKGLLVSRTWRQTWLGQRTWRKTRFVRVVRRVVRKFGGKMMVVFWWYGYGICWGMSSGCLRGRLRDVCDMSARK